MKRVKPAFILIFVFMGLAVSFSAEETRTLTIRCADGVLLVYAEPETLISVKGFLLGTADSSPLSVDSAREKLKSLDGYAFLTIEAFYEEQKILPKKKQLYSVILSEAVEAHLIPDIRGLSLQDARERLALFGFNVHFLSSKIGASGTYAPCDISVQSAGKLAGSYTSNLMNGYAWIFVNGKNVSPDLRGYNIAVIDPLSCKVTSTENFDTRDDQKGAVNAQKMSLFLLSIPDGKIVAAAVRDEGSKFLTPSVVEALKTIGAKKSLIGYRNYSHAVLGIKGLKTGQAMEDISAQVITLSVTKGLHTEEEIEKTISQSAGHSVFIRDTEADSVIGITLPAPVKN